MLRRIVLTTALLIAPRPLRAQDAASPDLLTNGGFEQVGAEGVPAGWELWPSPLPEPGCVSVDSEVAHTGARSLRIRHAKPTSYSRADQVVDLTPGKRYVISGWAKGEDIKPGPGSMLGVLFVAKEGDSGFRTSQRFSGTFDWVPIEIGPFDLGNRNWLKLIPYLHNATGTIWYDDLTIREMTPEMERRVAQQRARKRLAADMAVVEAAAREAEADDLVAAVGALRRRAAAATDLPVTLDDRAGPPYFPLHAEVFALMARTNRRRWPAGVQPPAVHATWADPFSDAAPLRPVTRDTTQSSWHLDMLRGDVEQAAVRLTNLTDRPQTATLSAQASTEGGGPGPLPTDRVTWRLLKYVETRDAAMLGDPWVRIGVGAGPVSVTLPAGISQDVWLMVDGRDDGIAPGRYAADVLVAAGKSVSRLGLTVACHGVTMPDPVPIRTFAYAYTTWLLLKDRVPMSRADLVAHRINTYVIHGGFFPWPRFDEKGERLPLDWSRMEKEIALHSGAAFFLMWSGLEIGSRLNDLSPPDGPTFPGDEWKAYCRTWLGELVTGLAERGLGPDKWALYIVDEPSGQRARIARVVGDLVQEVAPQVPVFENPYGAATATDMEHMGPVVDIWCPSLDTAGGERLTFCRKTAREVWTYQVLGKAAHPLRKYRLGFWDCFVKDLRGHGFWDYADGGGSMWDAWDHNRHDYAVVYDGDDSELTPSKRWEAYREGAEDYAVLWLLKRRDPEAAQALARKGLDGQTAEAVRTARAAAFSRLTIAGQ